MNQEDYPIDEYATANRNRIPASKKNKKKQKAEETKTRCELGNSMMAIASLARLFFRHVVRIIKYVV